MEKNNFWNEAAKCGAILGLLLAASAVLENWLMLSGKTSYFMALGLEWIVVVVLHYYLLHRYTRSHSMLYTVEEGFSFGQGYGYLLTVSGFAGIIVGLGQFLYLHVILGYSVYIERYIVSLQSILSQGGGVPASMESLLSQTFNQLQTMPEPSALRTVFASIFSSLLFGAIFGLIIAGVLSRAPKPFDTENNKQE